MTERPAGPPGERITGLLGLGVEAGDGHLRISRGEDFQVVLGSEDAHETMLALCVRLSALLEERGLEMGALSREEFVALLEELQD